jgi:hypothetical protein
MRKWLFLATAAAVLVAVPIVVFAAGSGSGSTPVNCIASQWRTSPISTSSPAWRNVPDLDAAIVQVRPVVINASASISGAPVAFRIRTVNVGGVHSTSKPGPTRFVPGGNGTNSFAYQWIDLGNRASPHSLRVRLQWKSSSGQPVHMLRGDLTESYATDACPGAP